MKAHLAKLSLALLSTVFLLGCQERGSEPVGPEGPQFDQPGKGTCEEGQEGGHCHGGDKNGDPDPITLNLANGMEAAALPVLVVKDTDKTLKVINTDFMTPGIKMNFMKPGTCEPFKGTKSGVLPGTGEVAELVKELTALVTSGFFEMKIDRTRPDNTSDHHGLLVSHEGTFDGPTGHTRIMLGSPFSQVDPVKVTEVNGVVTFTGPVVVWAHGVGGGGTKSDRIIQCPGNGDAPNKVTATLTQ